MQTIEIKGLVLSRMTLGTVQLGITYGISNTTGKPDYAQSAAILEAAMAGGVTSFDTAAAYGDSEVVLGRYFAGLSAELPRPIITTKLKMGVKGPSSRGETRSIVLRSLEGSLQRLGRDRVEILMLHNASDLINYGETIVRVLTELQDERLVEHIGVSAYTSAEVDEMLRYHAFDAIQVPINIMDTRLIKNGTLLRLMDDGIIVFVRSVFLQGLFFRDPDILPPSLGAARPYLAALREAARDEGLSVAELAFGYVRDLPGVTSLVVGAETVGQVRENLRLFQAPPASRETAEKLQRLFADVPEQVLNPTLWK